MICSVGKRWQQKFLRNTNRFSSLLTVVQGTWVNTELTRQYNDSLQWIRIHLSMWIKIFSEGKEKIDMAFSLSNKSECMTGNSIFIRCTSTLVAFLVLRMEKRHQGRQLSLSSRGQWTRRGTPARGLVITIIPHAKINLLPNITKCFGLEWMLWINYLSEVNKNELGRARNTNRTEEQCL
jgi:hypothetical protein